MQSLTKNTQRRVLVRGKVYSRNRQHICRVSITLPYTFTMSDKIKEFIEVPQQFIREGNQVGDSSSTVYLPKTDNLS